MRKRLFLTAAVLLLMSAGCSKPQPIELFNDGAAIPSGAPIHPLAWRVIASSIDPAHQTMATLFGNDTAVESARTPKHTTYPAGSVLALVTWSQKEDEHWFGGRIPKHFESMEIVRVNAGPDGKPATSYERLEGTSLKRTGDETDEAKRRESDILALRASVMP